MNWGRWHTGELLDIRIGQSIPLSEYRFRIPVQIREGDKISDRVGIGKLIGNFSPIWINWKGKNLQLTELLRQENKWW